MQPRHFDDGFAVGALGVKAGLQPAAFFRGQPFGFSGAVGKIAQDKECHDQSWKSFDNVHPLPTMQAHCAFQVENEPGNRRADDGGDRNRKHEKADNAGPVSRREPQREEEYDAGEEARFRHA